MKKILAALFCLSLIGCAGVETQVLDLKTDPTNILPIYVELSSAIFLLLVFFGGRGIWHGLLETIQYVGLISLVTCPFYYILTRDVSAAVAIGLSGFLAIAVTYFLIPKTTQQNSSSDNEEK